MTYICDAKKVTKTTSLNALPLIGSDDSVSYEYDLQQMETPFTSYEEYGSYQEDSSDSNSSSNIDERELQYYIKKLAKEGPKTRLYTEPLDKNQRTTCSSAQDYDFSFEQLLRRTTMAKTTYFYQNVSRTAKKKTKKTRKTASMSLSTAPVRRKRWAGDSYDDVEKYTTLDSLEKELLFSGKYAPWQRKIYAVRKMLIKNQTLDVSPRKKKYGKQKLKRVRRRSGGVIHEPGYRLRKRLNLSSYEIEPNITDFANVTEFEGLNMTFTAADADDQSAMFIFRPRPTIADSDENDENDENDNDNDNEET